MTSTNDGNVFIVFSDHGEVDFDSLSMRDRMLIRDHLDTLVKDKFLDEASSENCNFTDEMMAEHGPYEYGLVDELNKQNQG